MSKCKMCNHYQTTYCNRWCDHGEMFEQRTITNSDHEQEQRKQGCEYCRGEKALYQHTKTTKLYINTLGEARTLEVECEYCPPYADCALKNVPARSVFVVKYCPECGRRLED